MAGEYLMQGDSVRFAVVNLMVFVALFNTPKKHVLTHFVPVLLVDYMHLIITGSACYVVDLLIVSRSSALSTHLHVYMIVISHVFALFRSDHKW